MWLASDTCCLQIGLGNVYSIQVFYVLYVGIANIGATKVGVFNMGVVNRVWPRGRWVWPKVSWSDKLGSRCDQE